MDVLIRLLSVAVVLWSSTGCRAREIQPEAPVSPPMASVPVAVTHPSVPPPPPVSGPEDRLWVSLQAHLGRSDQSGPLHGAGSPLSLKDSGRDWSGSVPTITWRVRGRRRCRWRAASPVHSPVSNRQNGWPDVGGDRGRSPGRPSGRLGSLGLEGTATDGIAVRDWNGSINSVVMPVLQTAGGGFTLQGPIRIHAPQGLKWKGGRYRGPFRLQRDAYGSWTLIEQVPLERYLEGVVPHEIGAGSPPSALQAQTVLARTWAFANSHRFRIDGYHLCSDTQCQVYSDPRQAGSAVLQAIAATRGRLLSWQGSPISAVYHDSNGGVMASGTEAWAMEPQPYLRAEADGDAGWVKRHPLPLTATPAVELLAGGAGAAAGTIRFRWTRTLTAAGSQRPGFSRNSPERSDPSFRAEAGTSGQFWHCRSERIGPSRCVAA